MTGMPPSELRKVSFGPAEAAVGAGAENEAGAAAKLELSDELL
jgi:hypothetical protein